MDCHDRIWKNQSTSCRLCKRHWLNIEHPCLRFLIERCIYPVFYRLLVTSGLVSYHYERDRIYGVQRGRLKFVRVLRGFFESSEWDSANLSKVMYLKQSLRARVRLLLCQIRDYRTPVFIHVRREYVGTGATELPDVYYVDALRELNRSSSKLFFSYSWDDPQYSETVFRDVEPKYISRLSVSEDLALMSLCKGGVLSISTFSWWGAFFSKSAIGYLAPKYWRGWKAKTWNPPRLRGDFVMRYLDVVEESTEVLGN